jgi:hypothetical protein
MGNDQPAVLKRRKTYDIAHSGRWTESVNWETDVPALTRHKLQFPPAPPDPTMPARRRAGYVDQLPAAFASSEVQGGLRCVLLSC